MRTHTEQPGVLQNASIQVSLCLLYIFACGRAAIHEQHKGRSGPKFSSGWPGEFLVQHPTVSGRAAALRGQAKQPSKALGVTAWPGCARRDAVCLVQAYAAMQGSVAGVHVAQAHLYKPFRRSIQSRWCSTHTLQLQPLPVKPLRRNSPARAAMRLLVAGLCVASVSAGHQTHGPINERKIPGLTHSGYLTVDPVAGSKLFYMFYEAQERADAEQPPICLWLQAGTSPQLFLFSALQASTITHTNHMVALKVQHNCDALHAMIFIGTRSRTARDMGSSVLARQ